MMWLYSLGLYLYGFVMQLAAWFHPKAKAWVNGRKNWQQQHRQSLQQKPQQGPLVWVHCASLGEFEQGRPIIEGLKAQQPNVRILLTFFSPSGYEVRKAYPEADYVHYLPLDTAANAKAFQQLWQPDIAVFVKYEFWYHHLRVMHRQQTPVVLVSGLFREQQLFFKPYGAAFLNILKGFQHFFLQNEASAKLLIQHGIDQYTIAGDTRIDRVSQIAQSAAAYPKVEAFQQNAPTLVIGSSWPEDERFLLPFLNQHLPPEWKAIIAPHQIDERHLQQIEKGVALPMLRYSQATVSSADARVLLIDNIGMLSSLYQYGAIAYIGGAFGSGLHNTLEPIAFGLPVLFGPKYSKFEEARYLVEAGGGFSINNQEELTQRFLDLQDEQYYHKAAQQAKAYIEQNRGASEKAVAYVLSLLSSK
jgi:3-deoxy-D-manno-octulosonic-acid transferase